MLREKERKKSKLKDREVKRRKETTETDRQKTKLTYEILPVSLGRFQSVA